MRYTLGALKLHERSLKVHVESVLLQCQITLSFISFLSCFMNFGFDKSSVILGLYEYLEFCGSGFASYRTVFILDIYPD